MTRETRLRVPAALGVRLTKSQALALVHAVAYGKVLLEASDRGGLDIVEKGFARRLTDKEVARFLKPALPASMVLVPTKLGRQRVLGWSTR